MCGLVGIVGAAANQITLDKMLSAQHHRGPDFTGSSVVACQIALGHNRLAIIDLTAEANQPMLDCSGRYQIIFNGEIYNYLELKSELKNLYDFQTDSDTEVLLAAYLIWQEAMLERLNGMFAFVIYDQQTGTLFGARDRFGVKPFFYIQHQGSFYFASEIQAFKAAGISLSVHEKVWSDYLSYGSYGQPQECFWRDVFQLQAGHSFHFDGSLQIHRWYDFTTRVKNVASSGSTQEVQDAYEQLLIDSVRLRFRADVTVGFNLSGGLDSSTLLAMVNHTIPGNSNIKAYTFYTGDSCYDELEWVEKMLQQTQNPLKKVLLLAENIPQLARELSAVQHEPYAGIPTLAYYNLFKQTSKDQTIVLLDGQGMDEQWAGYDYYTGQSNNLVQGVKLSPTRGQVLAAEFALMASNIDYPKPFDSAIQNLQYRDLFYTKIPRALRFNERASMANSVELREPFLDYRLVELAFAQPDDYKIRGVQKKWMLRQIAQKYCRNEIVTAPKRALQTPQREWLGNQLAFFVEEQIERIASSDFKRWFDMDEMIREWQSYRGGNQDNAFYIWQWVSVGLMIEQQGLQ